jgi:hypothetical protein
MRRLNSRPQNKSERGKRTAPAKALIEAWFDTVLAGEADEPHPIHGERVKVKFTDGLMTLSGELDTERDRDELVRQAESRIGSGLRKVDAENLRVAERPEKYGVLDQILIAAFEEPDLAEVVRKFIIQRSRLTPKLQEVVKAGEVDKLRRLLPEKFVTDAQKALEKKKALLILRVDETDAFDVRRLLEEDTRSTWTIALPPEIAS